MKEVLTFERAREIWNRVVKSSADKPFVFDMEVHKRLLDLFHVGPYYYYVFNCATGEFDYLDESASKVTGYLQEQLSPRFFYTKVHPEDMAFVLNFEDTITSFYENLPIQKKMSYKTSYDYRIQTSEGNYIRILQQVTAVQVGEEGSVYRTFGIHTNITHLKPHGIPMLNVMGLNGEPSFTNVSSKHNFNPAKPLLTRSEQKILRLIAEGCSTEQIAARLFISLHTVRTHRRNIMAKTRASSSPELIKVAMSNGWI